MTHRRASRAKLEADHPEPAAERLARIKRERQIQDRTSVDGNISLWAADIDWIIAQAEQRQWISVEERLPEDGTSVLIWGNIVMNDPKQMVAWFTYDPETEDPKWYGGFPLENVTHWMPLPDPPEDAS